MKSFKFHLLQDFYGFNDEIYLLDVSFYLEKIRTKTTSTSALAVSYSIRTFSYNKRYDSYLDEIIRYGEIAFKKGIWCVRNG